MFETIIQFFKKKSSNQVPPPRFFRADGSVDVQCCSCVGFVDERFTIKIRKGYKTRFLCAQCHALINYDPFA